MILYRYRPVESAIKEIDNETFHFASREELNDPIEGFIRVYWQGDKAAWEGLLRNYVCSLNLAIDLYLLQADEDMLHHKSLIIDIHRFDGIPAGILLKELGDSFIEDSIIQKISLQYGTQHLKVQEKELRFILHFIHNKAMKYCIERHIREKTIPQEIGNSLLASYSEKEQELPFEAMHDSSINAEHRRELFDLFEDLLEDMKDYQFIMNEFKNESFLDGLRTNQDKSNEQEERLTEVQRRRNWMSIAIDFPNLYISQLKDLIYPESYVVCFSSDNANSAMWGNYADQHRGVCFIYETDKDNSFNIQESGRKSKYIARKIDYEGKTIERNFFTTFGRLTIGQVKTWLTGSDGLSDCYKEFANEEEWRNSYWHAFEMKNFQKIKAWSHECEYRIAINNYFTDYKEPSKRNLQYDIKSLRGVIFGIKTSEYDKKRIMEGLRKKKDRLTDFTFFQAEYDDEKQIITVRKKENWKLQ